MATLYSVSKQLPLKRSFLRNCDKILRFNAFSSAVGVSKNSSEECLQTSEDDNTLTIQKKSKMPEPIRRQMIGVMPDIVFDYQIKDQYKRRLYAKFGRSSGINPGVVCWPSEEELKKIIEHEEEFEPTLQEMVRNVEKRKQEEKDAIREREEKVERNLSKLDKWMNDIKAKKEKKLAEIEAQKAKKERLIEEVRQYFGYRLNPNDPKFQEILEKKEKEEKKAAKEAKKKEKFAKEMARLSAMAQSTTARSSPQNETTLPQSKTAASQPENSEK